MIRKLSHIGVAVRDLGQSAKLFSRLFEAVPGEAEVVEDQHVRVMHLKVGDASIELTEPTASQSPIAKFIATKGEGVHHLSFEVDDIRGELARLKSEGFQLIDEAPRRGAGGCWIAFVHPKAANGILLEISQKMEASEKR
jgi:methylmalonyl-CoA/ethylmalonyl-CoA epimerase